MNEPNVPKYSQHISQVCLRLKMTACSRKDALALSMSFMPNQAAMAAAKVSHTQMKPAFCSHTCRVTSPFTQVCGSPPRNSGKVITSGTTNCTAETPRLPSPAFRPSAVPFCALGKKKLMLAMLEEKLPPPKPQSRARGRDRKSTRLNSSHHSNSY